MDILIDKYITGLYQQMEDEVIADIARRVKKTGRYTETAELMAKSMHEQGYSTAKIQAEVMKKLNADAGYQKAVAENTKAHKAEIQKIIEETVKEAKEAGKTLIAEAGNMAWNNDLSMWQQYGEDLTKPNSLSKLIKAFQAQTAGALKNLTKTTGFKNTLLGTTGVMNAYQRELDLALLKVATGTFSYDQAVNDCIHRLAQSGLRAIDYASGRTYQLDTAARMCVRTGLSQLSGKIMEENLKQSGQDLVITSQHMGSRPEHVPWQNKVFSYSGKNKKYPDFFKETGYGTAGGLKGVNCTHDFYPFWEGASVIPDDIQEPPPKTINGKEYTYYQTNQQQRRMERNIRATKRELEAQRNLGGDTTQLKAKLKKQMSDYRAFSKAAGLRVKDNRLRMPSGTSNLSRTKATKYYNSLVKSNSHDIIKSTPKEPVIGNDNFRITKSKFLKAAYEDIKELRYSLSNLDVRIWYKAKDADIINIIDKTLPIEEQAKQACELRNTYRTQARELMRDQEKRKSLDRDHPNVEFEDLVKDKMERKGMTREEALRDTISTSGKTNKKVDNSLGLE
ncbi:MAG: phage minor capsid protein [Lachnospiraceae bacterium]|nr:phage minor capsid protein [Lachnospiraceae bacterium]